MNTLYGAKLLGSWATLLESEVMLQISGAKLLGSGAKLLGSEQKFKTFPWRQPLHNQKDKYRVETAT